MPLKWKQMIETVTGPVRPRWGYGQIGYRPVRVVPRKTRLPPNPLNMGSAAILPNRTGRSFTKTG